jgi:sugar phosphate isomerase/epimerase
MRALSLAYHTAPELGPLDAVRVAAQVGCTHVGMRLAGGSNGDALMPIATDVALRRAVVEVLRGEGLAVLEASTVRLTPSVDAGLFAPFCEAAAALGARFVLTNADDAEFARLAENVGRLTEAATNVGLETHFEFVSWSATPDLSAALALRHAIGKQDLKIALDALHFDRSHGRSAQIAAVDPAAFGDFHICDALHAANPSREEQLHTAVHERMFPGEGELDLIGMLDALPVDLPILIEVPMRDLARTVPAQARARRAVAATRNVLASCKSKMEAAK